MNSYRWSDLKVGLREEFVAEITPAMMDAFRRLSGDTNPLHRDASFATNAGFPGVVVFGLLTSSLYSRLAGVHLPGEFALLQGLDLHFVSPAFVGDRLRVSGEISHLNDAYRQMEIKAQIHRDETLISRAKIRVGIREQ